MYTYYAPPDNGGTLLNGVSDFSARLYHRGGFRITFGFRGSASFNPQASATYTGTVHKLRPVLYERPECRISCKRCRLVQWRRLSCSMTKYRTFSLSSRPTLRVENFLATNRNMYSVSRYTLTEAHNKIVKCDRVNM